MHNSSKLSFPSQFSNQTNIPRRKFIQKTHKAELNYAFIHQKGKLKPQQNPEPSLIFFHLHTKQKHNTIQEFQTQKRKKKKKKEKKKKD